MPMNNRLLRPRQTIHLEAADWANRVQKNGGSVSGTTLSAVDRFVKAIHAAGIRDRFYRLNLFCGNSDANLAAVRTPLFRGPSLTGTQFGNATDTNAGNLFVANDYAETGASGGLVGNGTSKYLNTGLAPSALPSLATGHLAAWTRGGSVASTTRMIGTTATVSANLMTLERRPSGGVGDLVQWGSIATGTFSVGDDSAGLFSGSRLSLTNQRFFKNGSPATAVDTQSATVTSHSNPWFVFAHNANGSPATYYQHRLASYSIGDGMTAEQMLAYYSALNTFMGALSRT